MTKHDIRIRRQSFNKGQIERHKDFQKFSGMYEKKRSKTSLSRLILLVFTLIILVFAVYFGYFKASNSSKEKETPKKEVPTIWDEFEQ